MIKIINSRIDESIVPMLNDYLNPSTHEIVINSNGGDLYYSMLLCLSVKAYNNQANSEKEELGLFPIPNITLVTGAYCISAASMLFVYAHLMGVPIRINEGSRIIVHPILEDVNDGSIAAQICQEAWDYASKTFMDSNPRNTDTKIILELHQFVDLMFRIGEINGGLYKIRLGQTL